MGSGTPSVSGATTGENAYLIDGMNTTNPRDGGWTMLFNVDAVQELSFQTGGFEAELGQAIGGIVNLVTKSCGNRFTGSLDLRYRDESFNESGDHYHPDELDEWLRQAAATLGGPLLRDRLWFFTSAQLINYTRRPFSSVGGYKVRRFGDSPGRHPRSLYDVAPKPEIGTTSGISLRARPPKSTSSIRGADTSVPVAPGRPGGRTWLQLIAGRQAACGWACLIRLTRVLYVQERHDAEETYHHR